ncbi:Protein MKS1 [Cocos nucifera]|nr:Protein MKS1 [Cocos nucifera]
MPSSRREIQGPRPPQLKVGKDSWKMKKPTSLTPSQAPTSGRRDPVIVYVHTPKIIHTRPQDFMSLVQQLTGKSSASSSPPYTAGYDSNRGAGEIDSARALEENRDIGSIEYGDPLLLTLGQLPSTPLAAPISPSLFFSSPNTHSSMQKFSSF